VKVTIVYILKNNDKIMTEQDPSAKNSLVVSMDVIRDEILPMLKEYNYDYSDVIPDRMLHSDDPGGPPKFKCRTNWFNVVIQMVRLVMGQTRDPLYSECEAFDQYMSRVFDWKKLRTAEEIKMATDVLDKLIKYFENEFGKERG
jgi:hypothetical protein